MKTLIIEYSLAARGWGRSEHYSFLWAVHPMVYPKVCIKDHKVIMKCLAP